MFTVVSFRFKLIRLSDEKSYDRPDVVKSHLFSAFIGKFGLHAFDQFFHLVEFRSNFFDQLRVRIANVLRFYIVHELPSPYLLVLFVFYFVEPA